MMLYTNRDKMEKRRFKKSVHVFFDNFETLHHAHILTPFFFKIVYISTPFFFLFFLSLSFSSFFVFLFFVF